MIKRLIQEEDIAIVNIYDPNRGAPQYIRQMLTYIKEEIDSNTKIVKKFNTSYSSVDRSFRKKIKKEIQVLNDTLNQMKIKVKINKWDPN